MKHAAARIPHRATTWRCQCGAEWGGDRKTCPTVRIAANRRRRLARLAKRNDQA